MQMDDLFFSYSFAKNDGVTHVRAMIWRKDDLESGVPTCAPRLYADVLLAQDLLDQTTSAFDKLIGVVRERVGLDLDEMYCRGGFQGVPASNDVQHMRAKLEA